MDIFYELLKEFNLMVIQNAHGLQKNPIVFTHGHQRYLLHFVNLFLKRYKRYIKDNSPLDKELNEIIHRKGKFQKSYMLPSPDINKDWTD
jgi:hypothetical protein